MGLENRIRLVTATQGELATSVDDVYQISKRTNQELSSSAQIYQRFAQNAGALGITLEDVAGLTDTVAKAVAISGASASSAQAALTQFGQSLASGIFRGQEFNSVMEQTPGLAMALARGLDVPIGQLRTLANEGKLTADQLVVALQKARDSVDEQFNTRVKTVAMSFTNLQTTMTRYVGETNNALGGSQALGGAIDSLSDMIEGMRGNTDGLANDLVALGAAWDAVTFAVTETYDAANEFGGQFQDMLTGSGESVTELGDLITTSFTQSFLATAKELDALWDAFDGSARALEALFDTATYNILAAFENVFNAIKEIVSEAVHSMATSLNYLPGMDIDTGIWVGPGALAFKSLSDAAKDAYAEGGQTLNLYDDLTRRLANAAIERSLAAEGYTTGIDIGTARPGMPGAAAGGGAGKAKKTKNEDPLGVFIKDMNIDHAMSEYQKYLDFIGDATGRTLADQIAKQQAWLGEAVAAGEITAAEYDKAMQSVAEKSKKAMSDMDQFAIQAARNIQDSLGDGLYGLLTGSFDDIGQRFSEMLLRMAADAAAANLAQAMFGDYGKTGQIGGILGGLAASFFGPVGAQAPGTFTPGTDWTANTGAMAGWDMGGYTGHGGKYEPAGIVHRGEYVLNQEATRRIGVGTLERMNKGYANGGLVGGGSAPAAPMQFEVNITNAGGQQMGVQSASPRFDGEKLVLDVMLKDLRANGPYARQLKGVMA